MSYVDDLTGNVNLIDSLGEITSVKTSGDTVVINAIGSATYVKVQGKLGVGQTAADSGVKNVFVNGESVVDEEGNANIEIPEVDNNYNNATNKPKINGTELKGDLTTEQLNLVYEKLLNLPKINGVELIGNKTTEDLFIVGTSMTEIELSTDMNNPTEIMNLINKSGTYVAKNIGLLGSNGEPMAVFAKGQFFSISNLQEYGKAFGLEVPDSENVIDVDGRLIDGEHVTYRIIGGTQLKEIIWLNSENVKDYVKVDFNPADFININYGIQFYNGKLAIYSATLTDIENGINNYKPITSNNIAYAVQTKGNNYFANKTDFTTLEKKVETLATNVDTLGTDLTTLKTEIETILESVVTVDE